jgi:hypothetical protein
MFHHISIAANEPFRVAKVLAELTGGQFYEFPITLALTWSSSRMITVRH